MLKINEFKMTLFNIYSALLMYNLANQTLINSGKGGEIKFKTFIKNLAGESYNIKGMDGNLLQNVDF